MQKVKTTISFKYLNNILILQKSTSKALTGGSFQLLTDGKEKWKPPLPTSAKRSWQIDTNCSLTWWLLMLLAKQPILADAYTLLNAQCQFLIPGLLYIA